MNLKEIQKPVKDLLEKTDNLLLKDFRSKINLIKTVSDKTPLKKGKRIRSTVLFLLAGMNDGLVDELPPIAASVEMFHLSSLIHDDVVDNSQLRRGARTLNFSFGNHISVLWGDYLFINSLFSIHKLRREKVLDIMLEAALLMIEGQLLEIENHFNTKVKTATYIDIIQKKTSSLFAGVCKIASLLNGDSPQRAEEFYNFGMDFGTIFQVIDDILDIFSENSGKDRFRDLKEGKITLPLILLLKSRNVDIPEDFGEKDQELFLALMEEYGIKRKCLDFIDDYYNSCQAFIRQFPDSLYKESLLHLLGFIRYRDY